eukprot:TRINITY_DN17215_c0_g1_i1.p1 TRINITY_DN17215_c0_g1~~TRINITY_DN17215_c0_g1_i1.p1  ORF type:complete len:789 (-),score=204.54 TRINITY_DN17215_c0_g1_i1:342-2708(-)
MGNLTFDMMYHGSFLGQLHSVNTSLLVGHNEVRMRGVLHPDDLEIASDLINKYLVGVDATIFAKAAANVSSFALFNAGMQGLSLATVLKGSNLNLINSVQFPSMFMDPIDNARVRLTTPAVISMNNPLGPNSPLTILSSSMAVEMIYLDQTIGTMSLNKTSVDNIGHDIVSIPINAEINMVGEGFTKFVVDFMQSEDYVLMTMVGLANIDAVLPIGTVHLKGIKLANSVRLQGMGGLRKGLTIDDFDLPSNSPFMGVRLVSDSTMVNPSVASVNIGTVEFDMFYQDVFIARIGVSNFVLKPGVNKVHLSGYVYPLPQPSALGPASEFFSNYLHGIDQNITVRGNNAGVVDIDWLQSSVRSIVIPTVFPGKNLTLIRYLKLNYMGVKFIDKQPYSTSQVKIGITMPWPIPVLIFSTLIRYELRLAGVTFVSALVDYSQCSVYHNQTANEIVITTDFLPVPMTNVKLYEESITRILTTDILLSEFVGYTDAKVDTAMGNLTLTAIPARDTLICIGMNDFNGGMKVLQLDVTGGFDHHLIMNISLAVFNPSNVFVSIGRATLQMFANNIYIGNATVPDFNLQRGMNIYSSLSFFQDTQPDPAPGIRFLSNYINGLDQDIRLKGSPGSLGTDQPIMEPAMEAYSSTLTLPGLKSPLTTQFGLKLSFTDYLALITGVRKVIPTIVTVYNPFSAEFAILGSNCKVQTVDGREVGWWIGDFTANPIVVPPNATINTPLLDVHVRTVWDPSIMYTFWEALTRHDAVMGVDGPLQVRIGDYYGSLNFTVARVPTVLL